MGGRWAGGLVAGFIAAAALTAPRAAVARTYSDFTCRGPDGRPTAIADSAAGWGASLRAGTTFAPLADHCATGGGIDAALTGAGQRFGDGAAWRFVAPANTSLAGFRIEWRGVAQAGGESTLSRSDQPDPVYVRRNTAPFSQTVEQAGLDVRWLDAIVACSFTPNPTCGSDPASFSITRARMTINDITAPQVSGVAGDLLAAPVVRGAMTVAFAAQDTGGGLYRVVLAADGVDRAAAPLPDTSGRCHDLAPGNADPYEFGWPQPCPLTVQTTVTVDTGGLPGGVHEITGYAEDAAGNRATLFGPVARTVQNGRGTPNGSNGGDGAELRRRGRRRVTTSFHHRRPVLRGTLSRAGQPVAGATLDVLALNRVPGARVRTIAEAHTDARGRYAIRVTAGPSRLLRVAYRAYTLDPTPAATVDVTQRVHAALRLALLRHRVPVGGRARFRGLLRGGFVPQRGKVVELQAFDGGRWRTFQTVRTQRSGRFRAAYRFRRAAAGRTFSFRALTRFERGYPYLLGTSPPVRLRVG